MMPSVACRRSQPLVGLEKSSWNRIVPDGFAGTCTSGMDGCSAQARESKIKLDKNSRKRFTQVILSCKNFRSPLTLHSSFISIIDPLRNSQVGQASSLTPFGYMDFGRLKT